MRILDHVVGITYLLDVLRGKDVRQVTVHGADGTLQAIHDHLLAEAYVSGQPACEFRPLAAEVPLAQGGRTDAFSPASSRRDGLGFRLDWPNHSMAYVTDTTATQEADYLEAIRGVDLLLHECYFPDQMADLAELTGHSVTTPVLQLARAAGVGRLVLVHVSPLADDDDPLHLEAALSIFPRTVLGHDLMEVDF